MSAETLRRAAALMRHDVSPNREFVFAVADWLEFAAQYRNTAHIRPALVVARAYLGEDA